MVRGIVVIFKENTALLDNFFSTPVLMDDLKSTTHLVLMHYMSHRLLKEKIQWPDGCPEDLKLDQPGKCEIAMTTVAEECEERLIIHSPYQLHPFLINVAFGILVL